ncbi:MAG TPA: glucosamine-6-phosphate deaminase [Niabella sp.]|nr:glucosamine-6-phosphate deaminase [Niabella sp.]HOZ97591.1 glucosamine-6-phosphate deaminase [Niabella sp.]HQW15729.1 glucosamine-6-phosphate deaminase [Niabella sp.]HQX21004.1 glucosamine-6-phosphate deaminase [Niabella sp.]HQX42211.1 glucosamine-6-phosphate deaminase [Niabella sp.]
MSKKNILSGQDSLEKIAVHIYPDAKQGSLAIAKTIADLIHQKQAANQQCVLGLATGSSPKTVYAELVRMHREEGLSFSNVVTFNLDEYYPITKDAVQSYNRFMQTHLFSQVDINQANIHIPNGEIAKEDIKTACADYEKQIEDAGGIDLQILGIGNNGHIGFNEPGSGIYTKTRLVNLTNSTRLANAYEFATMSEVPRMAITMGISTILKSRQILLMAWGPAKSNAVKKAVEEDDTDAVPASFLQNHDNVTYIVEEAAASGLTRFKSPWLTGDCEWTPKLVKKAVVNMALALGKTILSLTNEDYNESGLSDLLVEKGDAYEINLQVYYMLRDSITGWPGGKPNVSIPNHPERSQPYPKKVILFSPHPDDDIISMGGTFQRLVDQGHEVHLAYQTSGNIAVTDEFVTRFLDFAVGFNDIANIQSPIPQEILGQAKDYIASKKPGQIDTPTIREIKGLIRRGEARATCYYVGVKPEHIHFQNLPFYETGTIEKNPLGEEDIQITMKLLREVKPQQVYCAGDFADPHGTHLVCFHAVLYALQRIKAEGDEWVNDCWMWLYKGAWQEWDIDAIEMAVPMSPPQVMKKRFGIFIHQSQKDSVPFQGSDDREFWQRAEERNAGTAKLYADLGLTHYAAMEAFVRWHYS